MASAVHCAARESRNAFAQWVPGLAPELLQKQELGTGKQENGAEPCRELRLFLASHDHGPSSAALRAGRQKGLTGGRCSRTLRAEKTHRRELGAEPRIPITGRCGSAVRCWLQGAAVL